MLTRFGHFCFRRHWLVVAVWLLVMIAGSTAIAPLFDSLADTNRIAGTETGKASDVIDEGIDRGDEFITLVDNIDPQAQPTDQALERAVTDVTAMTGIKEVSEPRRASDGRAVAITVTLEKSDKQFQPFQDSSERMLKLADEIPGSTVEIGGGDLISGDANDAVEADINRAELLSLPITLIVLLIVFGGLVAAGLPLLTAIGTMLGASGLLLSFSGLVDLDSSVITVVTLLGLGLSIDYGLLLVARYREELASGHDYSKDENPAARQYTREEKGAAVQRAWGTAGRTILFSALTVAAALTGLLAFRVPRLQAMALAGISTTIMAMLIALTFTAAMLGLVGRWVKPSKKEVARYAAAAASGSSQDRENLERGFFARLARITQRQPLLVMLGTLGVLLAMAIPALDTNIKIPQLEALPRTIESVRVADDLDSRFGNTTDAAVRVVARTDTDTLDAYAQRWTSDPAVLRVEESVPLNPNLSAVVIAVNGDNQGTAARELVERLRADRPAGVESWVTGDAAQLVDLSDRLRSGLPLGIAIVVLAMLILLYLMTGSVIIPIKAVLMNAVSLAATFGVLVAIFQDGWLSGPLDTLTTGGLSPYMIVIVFAFAFGLSMDYEVFLLGRIKEYRDRGLDSATAVRHGLQRSGRIISAAALLMLIVFACFGTAKVGQIEQIGIGLFVAVLVDATLVRCLLVPATMSLLGRAAWWAPGPLKRAHGRVGLKESDSTEEHPTQKPEPAGVS